MVDQDKILNLDTIMMLKSLESSPDATDFLDDLIKTYLTDGPSALTELAKAIEEKNPTQVRHFSHKLKGSSRNLGATVVGDLCAVIEANAIKGVIATAEELSAVGAAFDDAKVALEGWIGRVK